MLLRVTQDNLSFIFYYVHDVRSGCRKLLSIFIHIDFGHLMQILASICLSLNFEQQLKSVSLNLKQHHDCGEQKLANEAQNISYCLERYIVTLKVNYI